jgi:hypothetical protein
MVSTTTSAAAIIVPSPLAGEGSSMRPRAMMVRGSLWREPLTLRVRGHTSAVLARYVRLESSRVLGQPPDLYLEAPHMSRYLSGCDRWYSNLRWQVINDRAGGICERCHKDSATQVHHLCYPRGRREQARDLLAVCDLCHYLLHFPAPANDNEPQLKLAGDDPTGSKNIRACLHGGSSITRSTQRCASGKMDPIGQ